MPEMPAFSTVLSYFFLAIVVGFALFMTIMRWKSESDEYNEYNEYNDEGDEEEPVPAPVVKVKKKVLKDQTLIDDFIALGSIRAVQKKNKVGAARVREAIQAAGLVPNQNYRNRVSPATRKAIQDELVEGTRTKSDIAREYGVSVTTVLNISRESL